MLEHLEPVILQTLRVCRPYVAALTLEQGLQKCSEVVQAAQKPGMGGVWLPLFCACLVLLSALMFPVYAVYAISSLDTGSPLRLRTRQRRRDTPRSCRALFMLFMQLARSTLVPP